MQSEQISVVLSYSILAREVPYQKFVSMVALRRVRATFCGSIDSIFARAVLYEGSSMVALGDFSLSTTRTW